MSFKNLSPQKFMPRQEASLSAVRSSIWLHGPSQPLPLDTTLGYHLLWAGNFMESSFFFAAVLRIQWSIILY